MPAVTVPAVTTGYAASLLIPTHVEVPCTTKPKNTSGASTLVQLAASYGMGYRNLPAVGDWDEYEVVLAAGTHTLILDRWVGASLGRVAVTVDGVQITNVDEFLAGSTVADRFELPGITISTPGKHLIRLTNIAANALSAGTAFRYSRLAFTRETATAIPNAPLAWSYKALDFTPHSIGTDGAVYGHQQVASGGRVLAMTSDGGATMTLGKDFAAYCSAGEYIQWVGRTTDGYVVVTSSDASLAGNFGGIWFGSTFGGTFTKVQAINGTNPFSTSKPELHPNGHTLLIVGEYSTDSPQPAHRLWLSIDGGQTWSIIRTAQVLDATKNSHFHGCAFDPTRHRIWSSQGDNGNARFSYSDDYGSTWVDCPMPSGYYLTNTETLHQQPTTVLSFPTRLCVTPDHSGNPAGVWTMDPTSATTAGLPTYAWMSPGAEASQQQFGRAPYVQSGNVAIIAIPDSTAGSKKVYLVGTGDAGVSWHLLDTITLPASNTAGVGIIGPDANGLVFYKASGLGAPYGDNLMVAPLPTFKVPA